MHSILLSLIIFANLSLILAMPYWDDDEMEINDLVKRTQPASWLDKRNPALCDYRFQLRPLPYSTALCAYSKRKGYFNQ